MTTLRQGDILFKAIDQLPKGLKKLATDIILRGESTGHAHRAQGAQLLSNGTDMFLSVSDQAKIVHEEHNTITLKKGNYAIIRQREYSNKDAVRLVID